MELEKQAAAAAHMEAMTQLEQEAMAQLAHANETISGFKAERRKLKAELGQAEKLAAKAAARNSDSQETKRKNGAEEESLREDNRRLAAEVEALTVELDDERQERSSEALRLRGQLQEAYTALEEERRNVQTTLARLKVLKE